MVGIPWRCNPRYVSFTDTSYSRLGNPYLNVLLQPLAYIIVAPAGIEPTSPDPESGVLPIYYGAIFDRTRLLSWIGMFLPGNHSYLPYKQHRYSIQLLPILILKEPPNRIHPIVSADFGRDCSMVPFRWFPYLGLYQYVKDPFAIRNFFFPFNNYI